MNQKSTGPIRGKVLPKDFFERPALVIARDLLGKILIRSLKGKKQYGIILETEAYLGPQDLASHSSKGRTKRTEVMFGPSGRWYVYLNYGLHWMLNVVVRPEGQAAAVLLRGTNKVNGPGRLGVYFNIDLSLNAKLISKKSGLWIEDWGIKIPLSLIKRTPRIGVAYAGPVWANKPYRLTVDKEALTALSSWNKVINDDVRLH